MVLSSFFTVNIRFRQSIPSWMIDRVNWRITYTEAQFFVNIWYHCWPYIIDSYIYTYIHVCICIDDICTRYDGSSHQFPLVKRLVRCFQIFFLAICKGGTMIQMVGKRSHVFLLKDKNYMENNVVRTGIKQGQQKMNGNQSLAHWNL